MNIKSIALANHKTAIEYFTRTDLADLLKDLEVLSAVPFFVKINGLSTEVMRGDAYAQVLSHCVYSNEQLHETDPCAYYSNRGVFGAVLCKANDTQILVVLDSLTDG
jgi:hypothetical protein